MFKFKKNQIIKHKISGSEALVVDCLESKGFFKNIYAALIGASKKTKVDGDHYVLSFGTSMGVQQPDGEFLAPIHKELAEQLFILKK